MTACRSRSCRRGRRSSIPYLPFVIEMLEKYPTLAASRLYEMVRERGYTGAPDHFRALVARHRKPKAAEAFLRLSTRAGRSRRRSTGRTSATSRSTARVGRSWRS